METEGRNNNPKVVTLELALEFFHQGLYQQLLDVLQASPWEDLTTNQITKLRAAAYFRLSKFESAEKDYRYLLAQRPVDWTLSYNLGLCLERKIMYPEAEKYFRLALTLCDQANTPTVQRSLANVLSLGGDYLGALTLYKQSEQLEPNNPLLQNNIALIYKNLGKYDTALMYSKKAIGLEPSRTDFLVNIASTLIEMERLDEAHDYLKTALGLNEHFSPAKISLAVILQKRNQRIEALKVLSGMSTEALDKNQLENFFLLFASLYLEIGIPQKAVDTYRIGISYLPHSRKLLDNILFALTYTTNYKLEYKKYTEAYRRVRGHTPRQYSRKPRDKKDKIKIGFMSADFRMHPVGYFFRSLCLFYDKSALHFTCLSNGKHEDIITAEIKQNVDAWLPIGNQSDDYVLKQMEQLDLDILFDLSGHTAGNRLSLFGAKPAPIQVAWIGYFETTGLYEMDYLLTTEDLLPQEVVSEYTEKPIYLSSVAYTFYPTRTPPIRQSNNTKMIYGCFNKLTKITPTIIKLWAQIIKGKNNCQIILKDRAFREVRIKRMVLAQFIANGINQEQIHFANESGYEEYLEELGALDVYLDTYPFSGCTTTFEAFWMGTPVLAMGGLTYASRQSATIVSKLGLEKMVATSEQEYVEIARSLKQTTLEVRKELRSKLETSDYMDYDLFAKDFKLTCRRLYDA